MFSKFRILLVIGALCCITPVFSQEGYLNSTTETILPRQWTLRPAGTSTNLGDKPMSIAVSPDNRYAAILHCGLSRRHEVKIFDLATDIQVHRVLLNNAWYGIAFAPDGKHFYVSAGADDAIVQYDFNNGILDHPTRFYLSKDTSTLLYPSGIAIDNKNQYAYIAEQYGNKLVSLDLVKPEHSVSVIAAFADPHAYPYKVVLPPNGKTAYVSLWGGKAVAEIDLGKNIVHQIPTDAHPNEMVLTKNGERLFVACANSNDVNVIDTKSRKVTEKLNGALYPNMPEGSTPNALTLTPDEKTLYVANADNDDLAVFDVSQPHHAKSLGFIPTGWYPTAVIVSPKKEILVANAKGNSSLPDVDGPKPGIEIKNAQHNSQYIGNLLKGSLSFIPEPNEAQLKEYTRQAYLCSPLRQDLLPVHAEKNNPIPAKVGDPSPIKDVVYIIKENRTYDQMFGDMPEGNGDTSLCLFGENVTPNLHKIAREFVLFDNLYADAEISATGHEWSTGAYVTDFVEKSWPPQYGGHDHPGKRLGYKAEGSDPVNDGDAGHLWNRAKEAGITYRSYGEWVDDGGPQGKGHTNDPVLKGHFDPYYTGWNLDTSDLDRVTQFQKEFKEFEKNGELPRLIIIRLPNDHTSGTSKGKLTPTAYQAVHDLAMAEILELLSHSQFWKQMAVFAIEDDAQNGSDHVDAHRTEGLIAGPFVKRNFVDHRLYSTTSFLRTMELILGLKPMSQFDAGALPLYASFTNVPNDKPYEKVAERVSLTEINEDKAPMQKQSSLLNFKKEDANPDILFNEIIWKSVKGTNSEMPPPVHAAFIQPAPKLVDKDED